VEPLERRQSLYVLLALFLFVGYESVEDAILFVGVGVLAWSALRLRDSFDTTPLWHRGWTHLALVASAGLGLLSGWSARSTAFPALPAAGFWRLGALVFIVHGLTRFDASSTGRSLADAARWVGGLGVAVGGLLSVEIVFEALVGSRLWAFLAVQGLLLSGGSLVALRRPDVGHAIARIVSGPAAGSRRARQRLDAYEAALLSDREDSTLASMRDELSISPAEHEVLESLARGETPYDDAEDLATGDWLQACYRLNDVVGQGARATVHRAKDGTLDRPVAVNVLDRQAARRPGGCGASCTRRASRSTSRTRT